MAALDQPGQYPALECLKTVDSGHGRIEKRTYYLSTEIEWYEGKVQWADLRAVGMACSKVESAGHTSTDTRYFITSLTDIKTFADAVRKHWGIENSLHWCLDVVFHEDYSRMRKDHSAENMAVVRHIALNILKKFPAKISLTRKRRRCAYDDAFFADVLRSVHA